MPAVTTRGGQATAAPVAKVQAAAYSAPLGGGGVGILIGAALKRLLWPDPTDQTLVDAGTDVILQYGPEVLGWIVGTAGGLVAAAAAYWKEPAPGEGVKPK